ncbi:MAG: hypothetical protein LBG96_16205 [Tannerella sp.]|jgi:hypothetical protein|nr:hypothetical protein [Tannerella sp.]
MKKTLIIALLVLASSATAQMRYKGSVNIELGGGINDMSCLSPTLSAGYVFNAWLAGYARYSLATKELSGFRFFENNVELLASLSPVYFRNSLKQKISFNINPGVIFKFQDFGNFEPTPSTHLLNIGCAVDAELEFAVSDYWSVLGRATYRALFRDERFRQEMFYSVGARMSLDIFKYVSKRLIKNNRVR